MTAQSGCAWQAGPSVEEADDDRVDVTDERAGCAGAREGSDAQRLVVARPALGRDRRGRRLSPPRVRSCGSPCATSVAVRLNEARLCAASKALHHLADLDVRDGFEIEASFRTQAHTTGGSKALGALVARTLVGTSAAWWLCIEDGVPRASSTAIDSVPCRTSRRARTT